MHQHWNSPRAARVPLSVVRRSPSSVPVMRTLAWTPPRRYYATADVHVPWGNSPSVGTTSVLAPCYASTDGAPCPAPPQCKLHWWHASPVPPRLDARHARTSGTPLSYDDARRLPSTRGLASTRLHRRAAPCRNARPRRGWQQDGSDIDIYNTDGSRLNGARCRRTSQSAATLRGRGGDCGPGLSRCRVHQDKPSPEIIVASRTRRRGSRRRGRVAVVVAVNSHARVHWSRRRVRRAVQ